MNERIILVAATCLLIVLANIPQSVDAATLPKAQLVPGGVAIIEFQALASDLPKVYFDNQRVAVVPAAVSNQYKAIVALPLTTKLGTNKIIIKTNSGTIAKKFTVSDFKYPQQKLNIADKSKVTPPAAVLKRINKEKEQLTTAVEKWHDNSVTNFSLKLPVIGRISGKFGERRMLNQEVKSTHRGIDIAADEGTPIVAAQVGTVTLVQNAYYTGNTVIINHGNNFNTIYAHLKSVSIKSGAAVQPGDVIGTVGKTGRATGPHLHWGVSLNGARVNPELFASFDG